MEDYLAVRVGFEDVPRGQQVLADGLEVVNFPVEDQDLGFVLIEHGLAAPGQVDNGQAAEAQGAARLLVELGVVRAAVGNGVSHRAEHALVGVPGKAYKTTHFESPLYDKVCDVP